jgi:DHA2 family lincomycin resistance protein-like MFS transporter
MSVIIPITGFLIRRVATRTLYGVAMGLFSTGTLVAALAPGFSVLLGARVVQASGTAIMLPLLMTTVMTLVPPARRGAVMGNLSIVISVAPAIGPTVSGVVLSFLGWRAVFLVVLPIALVTLWIGLRPHGRCRRAHPVPDRPAVGRALGRRVRRPRLRPERDRAGGASALLPTWVPFVVGGLGIAVFVARQLVLQRTDRALLDLRTFRSRTFTTASVIMMLMMATLLGSLTLLPIYMQQVLHLSPLATGLLLLPGGLTMGLLGPVVGRLYDRLGARCAAGARHRRHQPGAVVEHAVRHHEPGLVRAGLPRAALGGPRVRLHPAVHRRSRGRRAAAVLLRQRDLRLHPAARGRGGGGAAGQRAERRRGRPHRLGRHPVVATAGGVHQAFVVAAVLSVLAIVAAFGMRTPSPVQEPVDIRPGLARR